MADNIYMVAESTNLFGAPTFSIRATKDVQNGAIVGKGSLVSGETEIYEAIDDYTDGMFLVLNPAWSYDDSRKVNQNEENYVNKANVPFRAYKIGKDMKFKIANISETFAVGDKLKYNASTEKYETDANGSFEVERVEEVGFPYCIGSIGVRVTGDTSNQYGYATGPKTTKYTLRVIK